MDCIFFGFDQQIIIISFSGTIDLTSIVAQREMLKENYAGGQVGMSDDALKLSKINFSLLFSRMNFGLKEFIL